MRKYLKIIFISFLMIVPLILLVGCDEKEETQTLKATLNGGAQEAVEEGAKKADSQAVQMFNAQFEAYEGNNVNAPTVKQLITKVSASNAGNSHTVSLEGIKSVGEVSNGSNYKVDFKKDSEGYINKVVISEN